MDRFPAAEWMRPVRSVEVPQQLFSGPAADRRSLLTARERVGLQQGGGRPVAGGPGTVHTWGGLGRWVEPPEAAAAGDDLSALSLPTGRLLELLSGSVRGVPASGPGYVRRARTAGAA